MATTVQAMKGIPNMRAFEDALSDCLKPVEDASSLPAACYHNNEIQQIEVEKIFRQNWLGLGRADRFKEAGQYEAFDIAGVPLILILDNDRKLHAFNNSCRHRGARLLDGEGQCRGIRCPFHCWNYATDGRFVAAPHMNETNNFNPEDMSLIEFSLNIHAGFIFVCFNPSPPDFEKHIGDFDQIHSPWPLASLVSTRRLGFEVECNWKLFLDVFNEYYHLQFVHPGSINDIYKKPDPCDAVVGNYTTQFGETEGTGGLLQDQQDYALPSIPGLSGKSASGTRYTWIFPNMTFACSTEAMWIYEAYPITPAKCQVFQTLCFPKESVDLAEFETKSKFYYERFDAAVEEDRVALENQQLGLNSPYALPGRYAAGMEPSVAAFANWYARQLQ